jgi:hypothetical protein
MLRFINASTGAQGDSLVTLSANKEVWQKICDINHSFIDRAGDEIIAFTMTSKSQIEKAVKFIEDKLGSEEENSSCIQIEFPRELYTAMVNSTLGYESHGYESLSNGEVPPVVQEEWREISSSLEKISSQEVANIFKPA